MSSGPAFHLGRSFDIATRTAGDEPVLYPAKHLVTHGVILGMTGSGKTGLASVLLEEASLAGIPVIAIDPKGDLGNLLLAFPALRPEDFAPYAPEGEDPAAIAQRTREGLLASGVSDEKLARYAATERTIYTPGARLGRPLSLMPSLAPPPPRSDQEGARDRAVATASA
ncbi:MAG: ATP-binding protein, partial [Myxococcota bacterium]|nr:ATP-binding protein [Myxococcota bacterium]